MLQQYFFKNIFIYLKKLIINKLHVQMYHKLQITMTTYSAMDSDITIYITYLHQGQVVRSPIKLTRGISENFDFSFVTFWLGNLFTLFALQFCAVVISNYNKHHHHHFRKVPFWKCFPSLNSSG